MSMNGQELERIRRSIENEFGRTGILARVFGREKQPASMQAKIEKKDYKGSGKKIQDALGVRVVLYFPEDIALAQRILKTLFELDEQATTIDAPEGDRFGPVRHNLVFRLPDETFLYFQDDMKDFVDSTFEVQVRTIFSEGWHEVEHDLRYKCSDDWSSCDDLSRALNGIYATLETGEWSLEKLFDELAWRHYKGKRWEAMLRTKYRLRLSGELSEPLSNLLDHDESFAKQLFRADRTTLLLALSEARLNIPLNFNNLIYVVNWLQVKQQAVTDLTPRLLKEQLERINESPANP